MEDLVWKPLSTNKLNTAQVWVAYLSLGTVEFQPSKAYPVEINLGHSKGIVSLSGYHYGNPSQIACKVCVQTAHTESAEGLGAKMTSWEDKDFQKIEHFQESDSIIFADQLSAKNYHIPTTSFWCTEEIAIEITKFQDLLSEFDCKIGKLTLARLLTALDSLSSPHDKRIVHTEEVLQLYADLMKFDPTHSLYCKDEHSLMLIKQITSTREYLLP